MTEFLYRCRRRMDQLGFDRNGAIYRSIDQAYTAFLELNAGCSARPTDSRPRSRHQNRQESIGPRIRLKDHPTVRMIDRNAPAARSVPGRKQVSPDLVDVVPARVPGTPYLSPDIARRRDDVLGGYDAVI
jgi:hypothetical protein